jgi:hypothetical protein
LLQIAMKNYIRVSSGSLFSALLLGLTVFAATANGQEKSGSASEKPRYKDAALPIADRVADLLPRMSLEEKVEQLSWGWQAKVQVVDPTGTFTNETARQTLQAEWGAELKFTPRQAAILRNSIQRYQLEKTHLGDLSGRSTAWLYGIWQHELPAGARPGGDLGFRTCEENLHGDWR